MQSLLGPDDNGRSEPARPISYPITEVLYDTLNAKVSYRTHQNLATYWIFDRRTGLRYAAESYDAAQELLKKVLAQKTEELTPDYSIQESVGV